MEATRALPEDLEGPTIARNRLGRPVAANQTPTKNVRAGSAQRRASCRQSRVMQQLRDHGTK